MKSSVANMSQNNKGQISIWDLKITETIKKEIKKDVLVIKRNKLVTENFKTQYDKFMANGNVTRIIKHCGGGMCIETCDISGNYVTYYISKLGNEEYSFSKKAIMLPMDSIIFYNGLVINSTSIQDEILAKYLNNSKEAVRRVIKRKGDYNVLLEIGNNVISILQDGRVLEFKNINSIECTEDEVVKNIEDSSENNSTEDLVELQKRVGKGDIVEAYYGKDVVIGIITHTYGGYNESLCISYDSRTKNTAIPRLAVLKILGHEEIKK